MTTTTETELPAVLDSSRRVSWPRVLIAFLIGLTVALVLAGAALFAYERAHLGKIGAGVHAGSVDLSGLTRDQAAARLTAAYAGFSQGQLSIVLPAVTTTVTYADLGRHVDVNAMLDAALAVGRSGSPVQRVADEIRTAIRGADIAPVVTFDRTTLANSLARLAGALATGPMDASIQPSAAGFVATSSGDGRTLQTDPLTRQVILALGSAQAPAQQSIDVSPEFMPIAPAISSSQASKAAAAANGQISPIVLVHGKDSWTIPATTVASWLVVGTSADGTYGVQADPARVVATLNGLARKISRKAVDASFLVGKNNKVVGVIAGKDGRSLDVASSLGLIQTLLDQRAAGVASPNPISPVILAISPNLTTAAATSAAPQMRAISSWTTYYSPGAHNGNSANITIPAMAIDGTIVASGATFNFWKTVGEVSLAKGYKLGGAIINGHSVEGKTIGGGICSTSTTLFNAALRAGLQMGARMNHYYYISRYPKGLDATVFQDGGSVQNMTFTNDTPYPILIRTYARPGIVRFTMYSIPTGRTVTLSAPIVKNYIKGYTVVEYTKSLKVGQFQQIEYPADGQDVWVTRTVRDQNGKVLHVDTFFSHYARMVGIILKGKS